MDSCAINPAGQKQKKKHYVFNSDLGPFLRAWKKTGSLIVGFYYSFLCGNYVVKRLLITPGLTCRTLNWALN